MTHSQQLRGIAQRLLDLRGEHPIIINAALQDIAGDIQCIAEDLKVDEVRVHNPFRSDQNFLERKRKEYQEVKDGKR